MDINPQAEPPAVPAPANPSHVPGPDCRHNHLREAAPDMAELEASIIEVAHGLQDRYGDAGPTPQQEITFMREWLAGKGRSAEEIDAILYS